MEEIFLDNFIPGSILVETNSNNGIHIYENGSVLYVLANTNTIGPINKEIKEEIVRSIKHLCKSIKFISLYEKQTDFLDVDRIMWGTYVWFADAPTHYIHYDDNPSASTLQARKIRL